MSLGDQFSDSKGSRFAAPSPTDEIRLVFRRSCFGTGRLNFVLTRIDHQIILFASWLYAHLVNLAYLEPRSSARTLRLTRDSASLSSYFWSTMIATPPSPSNANLDAMGFR
jgi:hypothetical protein